MLNFSKQLLVQSTADGVANSAGSPPPMATLLASEWDFSPLLTDHGLVIAVVVMAGATLASVLTAAYLYRWRKLILKKPYLLSPEHLAAHVLALEQRVGDSEKALGRNCENLRSAQDRVQSAMERMIETYMALQPRLDERDREIQKLRSGYEAALFRRFVRRFVRVDVALSDRMRNGATGIETMRDISALLEDALAECGIERFAPDLLCDYRQAEGVADNPETVAAPEDCYAFLIASVRRSGYRFCEGSGDRIVVPAEVTVYAVDSTRRQKEQSLWEH